jgi:S-adenosylmethionine-dependent methyltransferase
VRAWYGVRVFTDTAATDAVVPGEPALTELLACEERAGATDPYRRVAALTHVIAHRAES